MSPEDEQNLREGKDFYWENGLKVMTADFLLRRGYCCESGCRHCPYGYNTKNQTGPGGRKKPRIDI